MREMILLTAVTKWGTFCLQHKITERKTLLSELMLKVTEMYLLSQEGRTWNLLKAHLILAHWILESCSGS